jgi:hypothetical protein
MLLKINGQRSSNKEATHSLYYAPSLLGSTLFGT